MFSNNEAGPRQRNRLLKEKESVITKLTEENNQLAGELRLVQDELRRERHRTSAAKSYHRTKGTAHSIS